MYASWIESMVVNIDIAATNSFDQILHMLRNNNKTAE